MADYKIQVGTELDTSGINTGLKNYKGKIKVGAELNTQDISNAISSFKPKAIDVNTKLSTKGITEALKNYQAKKTIKVDGELDVKNIDSRIASYQPKPIKVDVELTKSSINQQIRDAKPSEHIKVDAKLNDSAISEAIKNYKTKSKINVGLDLDYANIEQKIGEYEVRSPLKVKVKINKTDINQQISQFDGSDKHITVKAKLDNGSINEAIRSYKAASKIKVDLELDHSDIDKKVKAYKASGAVELPVRLKLNIKDIASQLQKYKLTVPVELIVMKLDTADIDKKISGYTAKTPIKVDVKLDSSGINEQIKGYKINTPLKVVAELDANNINNQVKNLKVNMPIKVALDLDTSKINEKIKSYKIGEPIKANIQLDNKNIGEQIRGYLSKTTIRLNVDLDTKNIESKIRAYKTNVPISVGIKLNDAEISKQIGKHKISTPIQANVKIDAKDIESQIKNYKTKSSVKVSVKLDTKKINEQIRNIKTRSSVKVGVKLDTKGISSQIKSINLKTPVKINVKLDTKNVQKQINDIKRQIQNLGNIKINLGGSGRSYTNNGARSAANEMNWAYKQMLDIQKKANALSLKINGLDTSKNVNELKELSLQFARLRSDYEILKKTFGSELSTTQFGNLQAEIDETNAKLSAMDAKFSDVKANFAKDIKLNLGGYEAKVESLKTKIGTLAEESNEVKIGFDRVKQALHDMQNASNDNELIEAQNRYQMELKETEAQLRKIQEVERQSDYDESFGIKKEAAIARLNGLFEEGSRASKEFGGQAQILRRELDSVGNIKGVDRVNQKIAALEKTIKSSNFQTKTLGSRLKEQFSKYSQYLSIASVFMYATQAARSMFEQVKLIDSAMTELKKVTNETEASYNKFLSNAAKRSKELGTTLDGLISSTADFARLGYGFEDSQKLAEVANIYAVVGDEIEGVEDATQSLVSTMAAFKSEMNGVSDSDFALSIVDKMNEVSNNFAISSGGIGQALQRSASSMAAANNTIDETIALITAANTVAQNPEKVGNAFKTMSMRIRGAKTELEEAGESTDGMAESTASLRAEIKALSGVDIMLDENTFKSTYQIMEELSQKWESLTDIAQASIIELIAGKHQGNVFSSLMANFDIAQNALQTSLESSGSAMAEHAKWSESLEARLNKLKAAWQSFAQTFMDSKILKGGIDLLTGLIGILDKLIESLGSFGTIGLGIGIYGAIKNFSTLKTIFASLTKGSAGAAIGIKALATSVSGAAIGIGALVAVLGLAYNAIKKSKEAAAELRQETIRSSDEFLNAASSFEQAYIKYSGKTNLTTEEESELESAINGTVDALGDKSSALQDVVNSSNDYVSSLEAIAREELKAANRKAAAKLDAAEDELLEVSSGWTKADGGEVNVKIASGVAPDSSEAAKVAKEIGEKYYGILNSSNSGTTSVVGFELSADASLEEIVEYYNMLLDYQDKLRELGLDDTAAFDNTAEAIGKMETAVSTYIDALYDASKLQYEYAENNGIPKTAEEYLKMRESILSSDDIVKQSVDTRKKIASALDSEYSQVFDLSSAEVQARKLIGILDEYTDTEAGTMETFLNVRTAVNNNDCTVGEYLSQFDEIDKMTEGWSDEAKKELNTSFGLDTDTIKQQYEDMEKYLLRMVKTEAPKNPNGYLSLSYLDSYTENYDKAKSDIEEFLKSLTSEELATLVSIRTEIDWEGASDEEILKQLEDRVKLDRALNFETNIEIDTTALEALNTALSESASAIGLTEDSIDSLKSKYSDLEGYNPHTLFEKTANGVKVNREEVAKLEKKYNDLKKSEVQEHLDTLVEEYNKCTKAIDGNIGSQEKLELLSKREKYAAQIEELAEYQAQLEGVTGAYQRWLDAQNTPEDYEGYQAVATSREDIKDEIGRGFISNASKEYIDLLSGKDLQGGTIDDYANAWEKLDDKITGAGYSINDFFTVNDDGDITATGIDRFFKSLQTDFEGSVAKFDKETEKWTYDFGADNLKKIQDEWGIGIEAIELILEAAESAGYDVDWGGIFDNLDIDTSNFESVEAMISLAEKAQEEFNKLEGVEDVEFNFRTNNVEEATTEVEKARKAYLDLITNDDGSLNLKAEGAEQMQFILATLLTQKQQLSTPAIMKVDTSQIDKAKTDVIEVIDAAKSLQTAYENYEIAITTGVDVEGAKKDLNSAIDGMKGTSVDVRADLKLPTNEELETAKNSIGDIKVGATLSDTAIGSIATKIQTECTPEVIAKVTGLDESAVASEPHQVVYTAEHKDVDDFLNSLTDISKKIIYKYTTKGTKPNPKNINRTITYKYKTEGDVPEAYGTANANGSASCRAFARGNWGIKGNGVALGGELGQELVVRDGRFFTIGDEGAEFFRYKKNDIVFNAAQTESLFKYGGIKGAKPRGTMLATGTAFAEGGRAFAWNATGSTSSFANKRKNKPFTTTKTTKKDNSVTTTTTTTWDAKASESSFSKDRKDASSSNSSSTSSSTKSASETKDEFEEVIDWIEVAISRIEREIDNLDKKAGNVYKSWGERNSALKDQISKVGDEIELQQSAYKEYMDAAADVGLSSSWAEKIRNGSLDISTITDEDLKKKIDDYKKYYEAALACKDAIEELKEKESELYKQRFDNVATQYEGMLSIIEHEKNMLDEYISQTEAQAHLISANYYNALIKNEESTISKLKAEKSALLAELQTAMSSGTITKGSEAWVEMVNKVDEVTLAIEQSNTAILEYQQSIQQLKWEQFDLLQEKISAVTEEADFLIELMSNDKLFDDKGKITNEGSATMGLHGVNYNTYMHQADLAREEAERIKKELAKDPYDTELEERYREMIALQQEHILSAEGEKEAIRDLVSDGIELELDALQELIDKKNEELESAKDLYEYQKKVKEQTEEIAALEKQMAAYENDDSEETKAKLQQIKVDLESARQELQETETDRLIESTAKILDELYLNYEEVLNMRLDNLDALIENVIAEINADSSSISDTIHQVSADVGYTLTESMSTIWDSNSVKINNVITAYGERFSSAQTTTNNALNAINSNLQNMIVQLNSIAKTNVKSASTSSAAKSKEANTNKKEKSKKEEPKKPEVKQIKVGGKINAGNAPIYDYAGDTSGERQLYRDDPIYTVLSEKNGYLLTRHHKLSSGYTGWFKKSDVKAYATGAEKIDANDWAWTQEGKKQEFIVRPSDGAILTPVAKGDSVLNAQASKNIWNMANSPAEFIKDNLSIGSGSIPNNSGSQNSISQNFENITFTLPNVRNYNELLSDMQKDPKFEKLILAMTLDQVVGKSKLAKGKVIR